MTPLLRHFLIVCAAHSPLAGWTSTSLAQTFLDFTEQSPPYRLFLPEIPGPVPPIPLVVMLHGCEQDSQTFASVTRMNTRAAERGFVVVYPEQTDPPLRCWHWYEPEHQVRGKGEPAAIVKVVAAVKARDDVSIDPDRVYIAGLSAGASMAVIAATAYPDIFAALGSIAGVPYGAAADCLSGFNAMQRLTSRMSSTDAFSAWVDYGRAYSACWWAGYFNPVLESVPEPSVLGNRAFEAMGDASRIVPIIVFQGLADRTVRPDNAWDLVSQWAQTDDLAADGMDDDNIDDQPESVVSQPFPSGHDFVERSYTDDQGNEVIRFYMIEKMGHAWPGGAPSREYSDPAGPDASELLWSFFEAHPKTGAQ